MSSTRANRVSPPTVTQYVLETVRADILSGRYPMNSRLDQQAIAAELGVSIIPVRECLRQLKGWCRFRPGVACSSSSCRSTSSARFTASAKCSKNWQYRKRCRTDPYVPRTCQPDQRTFHSGDPGPGIRNGAGDQPGVSPCIVRTGAATVADRPDFEPVDSLDALPADLCQSAQPDAAGDCRS